MNRFQYISSFIVGLAIFAVPQFSLAALGVTFEATPLFSEANVMPGDAVARTVTVSNTGVDIENVEFTFDDVVASPLAGALEMAVTDGSTVFVFDTFDELFASAPHALGTLAPNESKTYTFTAAFPASAGNQFQNDEFSFDLQIGFVGAEQVTDRNGGGSGGTQTLQIFNEIVTPEENIDGVFISWNSNRRASTYLICGNLSNGPFVLTENSPLFGYEFSLDEQDLDTTTHGFALSELEAGEYECRPAGREASDDGFTVGDSVQFNISFSGRVAGDSISLSEADIQELLAGIISSQPRGSVLGVSEKGAGNLTYEEFRAELDARNQKNEQLSGSMAEEESTEVAKSAINSANNQSGDASNPETSTGEQSESVGLFWPIAVIVLVMVIILALNLRSKKY